MIKENYYYGNYVGLSGPAVNMIAVKYTEKLLAVKPDLDFSPHLQARVKRDGNDFHVTMVSKADLEQLKIGDVESERKALMEKIEVCIRIFLFNRISIDYYATTMRT